jgi:hypothetical protein
VQLLLVLLQVTLSLNFERDSLNPSFVVLFQNDRVMILFIPALEVDLTVSTLGFDQAYDIAPKPRVSLQIKTTNFNIAKSPNTHGYALL